MREVEQVCEQALQMAKDPGAPVVRRDGQRLLHPQDDQKPGQERYGMVGDFCTQTTDR